MHKNLIRAFIAGIILLLTSGCDDSSESNTDLSTDTEIDSTTLDSTDQHSGDAVDQQEEIAVEVVEDTEPEEEFILEGPRELLNGTPVTIGHIVDGDTLDVLVGDQQFKRYSARLKGINAPECYKEKVSTIYGLRYQCTGDEEFYGLKSLEGLQALAAGKKGYVTCDDVALGEWCPQDDYERYLVYIEIDGKDLATETTRQGNALSYTLFWTYLRAEICSAEFEAQEAHRGMWASGSVDSVISQMSYHTQNWYEDHDWRCYEAIND